jgi:Uma2 family endonuclease
MTTTANKRATYADLEAVPSHLVAEIIFGSLVTHPRPSPRHAAAASALGIELGGPFQKGAGGPGGWLFLVEPELHLGEHVVVPDIAGWRRERLPELPDTAWLETTPDWVCEVLSPSTQRIDRHEKRSLYASAGLPHLWLLDPLAQVLEVFRLNAGKWTLVATFEADEEVSAPPFAEHPFKLSVLWPFDPPARTQSE